ncbi:MAG: hypothetical protein ABIW30_01145 [Arenimonas sp.]
MIEIRKLALLGALTLFVSACDKEGSEDEVSKAAPSTEAAQPATPSAQKPAIQESPIPSVVQPVTVAADAVTVGTALQGDRVVKAARAQFTLADTVYASASVRGKPPGAEVMVYWTYVKDGNSLKQETRKLAGGEQTIWFSFAKADGMKPGKYNVEIDVNMVPVGITDFQIN